MKGLVMYIVNHILQIISIITQVISQNTVIKLYIIIKQLNYEIQKDTHTNWLSNFLTSDVEHLLMEFQEGPYSKSIFPKRHLRH